MTPDKHSLPLIWASAVRPDGSFSASGGDSNNNPLWFRPPIKDVTYATKAAAVIVQRTSNRDQLRRLNAAVVSPKFRAKHQSGFVAENHVIVLEATSARPRVSPARLAAILNSAAANERFSAVSGSFSVSARLLSRLALPDPAKLPAFSEKQFSKKLEACFASIDGVLIPDTGADRTQDPVDKTANLPCSVSVNNHSSLKARGLTRPKKVG
jgi:adenine-specific DNA-methyltransferase